jgi:hypothetical protein
LIRLHKIHLKVVLTTGNPQLRVLPIKPTKIELRQLAIGVVVTIMIIAPVTMMITPRLLPNWTIPNLKHTPSLL